LLWGHVNKVLAGFFALGALIASPALAADMAVKAPPAMPAPAPVYSWTGWYVGANAGYGWSDPTYIFSGVNGAGALLVDPSFIGIGVPHTLNTSGFIGGGQLGYNRQFNRNWLAGLETDIDYADVRGSDTFPTGNSGLFGNANRRLEWFGTLRPRIGFLPTDRFLVFATGGLAYGETRTSSGLAFQGSGSVGTASSDGTAINCAAVGPCVAGSNSRTSLGWVVGGGLEYAVTNSVTMKAEYLYMNLGSQTVLMATALPGTGNGLVATNFDNAFQFVRVGINWRFSAF
jgi:outer membrane immunogenic protein